MGTRTCAVAVSAGVSTGGLALIAALLLAGCVAPGEGARADSASSNPPFTSVDDADFMAAWQAVATPGRPHEFFELLQGTWTAEVTVVMAPGAEAQRSRGRMVNSIIHGGRFLLSEYVGAAIEPFGPLVGRGWLGFDNADERYQGVWIDNMSTTMRPASRGALDISGLVLTMHASYYDPFEGRERTQREVTTILGRSRHTFEVFNDDGQGGEFRGMFIAYSRSNEGRGR